MQAVKLNFSNLCFTFPLQIRPCVVLFFVRVREILPIYRVKISLSIMRYIRRNIEFLIGREMKFNFKSSIRTIILRGLAYKFDVLINYFNEVVACIAT